MKAIKISKNAKILATILFGVILLIIGLNRQSSLTCSQINVEILNQHENYFLNKKDIVRLITKNGENTIYGQRIKGLNLKKLEEYVESNKFVNKAEVFIGYDGVLYVKVFQRRPIARIVRSNLPDAYVDKDGILLPISSNYTARVPLITGVYLDEIINNGLKTKGFGEQFLFLLKRISQDKFLDRMIVQLIINKDQRVELLPQIGKQVFEFGRLENIENKLKKIKIAYKKILPFKGWNDYSRVNLEFDGQIICE